MPAIPLPFVVALLLVILLAQMAGLWGGTPADRNSRLFVAACAVLVTIVGLRWSFDFKAVRFIQPIFAATLPPIAWFCFAGLARSDHAGASRWWLHAIPIGLIFVLSVPWNAWRTSIDVLLAVQFFAYGAALLRLAAGGPDRLGAARISEVGSAHRAVALAGVALIVFGGVDLLVAADLGFNRGSHAASIVTAANLAALILIACLVAIAGRSRPAGEIPEPAAPEVVPAERAQPQPEAGEIVAAIDRLMRDRQIFRDPDLTLSRLARRAGIPARQISAAINRLHGRNVSQVVNEYRIAEAKRLLEQTDQPITEIMFACGFQTKSNFNREFRRVAGASPSDYRQANLRRADADPVNPLPAHPPGT